MAVIGKVRAFILNFAPFIAMLYIYFFYEKADLELKFTAIFLTSNYYFARTLYLARELLRRRAQER